MKTRDRGHHTGAWAGCTAIIAAVTLLLGGCGLIMGEDLDGLMIPVTNNTDQNLIIRQSGGVHGSVDAGRTSTVEFARVECTTVVNAVTEDQSMATRYPGEVCEGDSWVIEQDDLSPYYEVFPLSIDVANFTDFDLEVYSDGVLRGRAVRGTTTLEFFGLQCTQDLVAVTEDGGHRAVGPERVCEVGRWEISPEELDLVTDDSTASAVVEPFDGSTVLGEVLLRAEDTTGAQITQIVYLIDGTVIATATTEPFTATWDTATAATDTVEVTAVLTTADGATTTTDPITLRIAPPGTTAETRLQADLDNGVLTPEDFTRHAVYRWMHPADLPSGYVLPAQYRLPDEVFTGEDGRVDITFEMIWATHLIDTLDPEVRAEVYLRLGVTDPDEEFETLSPEEAEERWGARWDDLEENAHLYTDALP